MSSPCRIEEARKTSQAAITYRHKRSSEGIATRENVHPCKDKVALEGFKRFFQYSMHL